LKELSPAVLEAVAEEIYRADRDERVAVIRRLAAALGVSFRYLRRATTRHGHHYEPTAPAAAVEIAWPVCDEMPMGTVCHATTYHIVES